MIDVETRRPARITPQIIAPFADTAADAACDPAAPGPA
jgi:acyl-ACP thioesterase